MHYPPDPDLLHTFVAIVENGGFTSAAKRIHRSQSAVSMQMRRLEEITDCSLFERTGRSIRLTNEGEIFFDHARRILRAYREAMTAFDGTVIEGEVTIGFPDDYATSFLPTVLSRFSRLYSGVHLHLVCEPSKRLVTLVNEGSIDVALVTEGEAAATGTVVHQERLVWVSSIHSRVHDEDPVSVAIFHTGDVFRRYAIEQLETMGRRAKVKVTSPTYAGICAAVDAGIAVGVLFQSTVRSGWRILSPKDGYPNLPELGIVLERASSPPSDAIDRLVGLIVECFRNLPRRIGADNRSIAGTENSLIK